MLSNIDLITAEVRHVPELASLDMSSVLVRALRTRLCTRVVTQLLDELDRSASTGEPFDPDPIPACDVP